MPTRRQLLQKITLNDTANSVVFSNIPQNYTDLLILSSCRSSSTGDNSINARFNSDSSSSYSRRFFFGNGSSTGLVANTTTFAHIGLSCPSNFTSNTFSNSETYIPNYSNSSKKKLLYRGFTENIATTADIAVGVNGWNNTSAITSITFIAAGGSQNFVAGSTFYLYGITHVPIINGGEVSIRGGFKYHTFRSTGTLQVVEPGDVEYLVVAGGGGGGTANYGSGGGGAGGMLTGRTRVNTGLLTATIGAGGAGGGATGFAAGVNGSNSSFNSVAPTGGGGGAGRAGVPVHAGSGGSGGGGSSEGAAKGNPGTGIAGQGNNGGNGVADWTNGGGGGAGAVGGNGAGGSGAGGAGGIGRVWPPDSTTYYAGGGGGSGTPGGVGGLGGGGTGSQTTPSNGMANTGGGGGSANGTGGSGIVVIRYPYDGN